MAGNNNSSGFDMSTLPYILAAAQNATPATALGVGLGMYAANRINAAQENAVRNKANGAANNTTNDTNRDLGTQYLANAIGSNIGQQQTPTLNSLAAMGNGAAAQNAFMAMDPKKMSFTPQINNTGINALANAAAQNGSGLFSGLLNNAGVNQQARNVGVLQNLINSGIVKPTSFDSAATGYPAQAAQAVQTAQVAGDGSPAISMQDNQQQDFAATKAAHPEWFVGDTYVGDDANARYQAEAAQQNTNRPGLIASTLGNIPANSNAGTGLLTSSVINNPSVQQAAYTPLTKDGRMLATQLIGYKQAYDNAAANNDEAGMKGAQMGAEVIRNAAKQKGIDLTPYDSGKTSGQAIAALQADYDVGYGTSTLGGMTTPEYYSQRFNLYKKSGASDSQADHLAQQDIGAFQSRRIQNLRDAFYNYGLTSQGAVNQIGAQILDEMRAENPDSIQLPNAYFAHPLDDYNFARWLDKTNHTADVSKDMASYNTNLDIQKMGAKTGYEKELQNNSTSNQIALGNAATDNKSRLMGEQAGYTAKAAADQRQFYIDHPNLIPKNSNSRGSGDQKTQIGWLNKLRSMKQLAYQSLGTPESPGTTFSDENDHNFEQYRDELYKFIQSKDVDEEDINWAKQELDNLEKNGEAVASSRSH